ncbi:bifunctional DNA primase/polymerase [Acidisoma sp. 7E03]
MSTVLQRALRLAEAGYPVFPCGPQKRPTIPKEDGAESPGGFHLATADADGVRDLWRRWPGPLVGIPTGPRSGFDALDIDAGKGGMEWWKKHRARLPDTFTYCTRSGGLHALFRAHPSVRNSESKIARGVDTRGTGGYIIAWWACGCGVATHAPIEPWPAWLLDAYVTATRPPPAARRSVRVRSAASSLSTASLREFVDRQISRVKHAADGQRHYRLRAAACTIGGVLDRSELSEGDVTDRLLNAVADAGAEDMVNAAKTVRWGLERGATSPLEPKERRR